MINNVYIAIHQTFIAMTRIYFETEENITRKQKMWVDVDANYIQMYSNIFKSISKLKSQLDTLLVVYMTKNMNKENVISISSLVVDAFINDIIDAGGHKYSKGAVHKSLGALVEAKLIIRLAKGQYHINPMFFWKDDIIKRVEQIKDGAMAKNLGKYIDIEGEIFNNKLN